MISTDIARDGMLTSPAVDLYIEIKNKLPELELMASGGIGSIDDVTRLNDAGIDGVIIGKAIYEGKIKLEELEPFLC